MKISNCSGFNAFVSCCWFGAVVVFCGMGVVVVVFEVEDVADVADVDIVEDEVEGMEEDAETTGVKYASSNVLRSKLGSFASRLAKPKRNKVDCSSSNETKPLPSKSQDVNKR